MKKVLALILTVFIFAISVHAQKDTVSKQPVDTAATETTPLLSIQDIQLVVEKILADQPMRYSEPVRNALYSLLNQRAKEYADLKKLQAKQK